MGAVQGTAGRHGLERFLLGSVAETVIRESSIPVISLRAVEAHSPQPTPVRRVLVLQDFSTAADHALDFVARHFPEAQIDVLHAAVPGVLEGVPAGRSGLSTLILSDKRQAWLERVREKLGTRGGGEVVEGDPATLALAESGNYDLLALGTGTKGTLERLVFGSVARKVVRESRIPVLTVRG